MDLNSLPQHIKDRRAEIAAMKERLETVEKDLQAECPHYVEEYGYKYYAWEKRYDPWDSSQYQQCDICGAIR